MRQGDLRLAPQACDLCPRQCGVDRAHGQIGFCRAGAATQLFRYAPHYGEEPPLSGTRGSGTVFFSRCTLRCVYCQNYPWSQEGSGETMTVDQLAAVFADLAAKGCHNLNMVSPTPWLPMIAAALTRARDHGMSLPVVYNTSGFERVETLRRYPVDIYVADLRYASDPTARRASQCPAYVATARTALMAMWDMAGPLQLDEAGIAVGGVICRLLILPNRAQETVANLQWLARTIGTEVSVSVMSQYLPAYEAVSDNTWNRRIDQGEYAMVKQAVEDLGFEKGWVQEFEGQVADELVGFRMRKGATI